MRVVGCSIFRAEVEHVLDADAVSAWLPAGLHVSDERLGAALAEALGTGDGQVCLYGACHPDIDAMLEARGGRRLAAQSCVEAFLDPEERARLPERAFIMSPGWLREWRSIFVDGMGWDEIDGRINFGLYDVVVVLDFGVRADRRHRGARVLRLHADPGGDRAGHAGPVQATRRGVARRVVCC